MSLQLFKRLTTGAIITVFALLAGSCPAACSQRSPSPNTPVSNVAPPDSPPPIGSASIPTRSTKTYNALEASRSGRPHLSEAERRWLTRVLTAPGYYVVRKYIRFAFPSTLATSHHPLVVFVPAWHTYGGHILGEQCNFVFDEVRGVSRAAAGSACSPPTPPPL